MTEITRQILSLNLFANLWRAMSQTQKKWVMLLIGLFVNIPLYLFVNSFVSGRGFSNNVALQWDYSIPFIKFFGPFYATVYFVPVVCFFICWKNYEMIKAGFKAFVSVGLVCIAFYALYPVQFGLRESLFPPYDLFDNIVRFFYWADDPPFNCFPSLHVAGAFVSARLIYIYRRDWAKWFYALAIMISLSTLFIRQHYLIDVVGGYLLYLLVKQLFLPADLLEKRMGGSSPSKV